MVLINFLPRSIRLERISLLKNYIRNFLFRSRKKTCNSKKKKNNQLTRILEQIHEFKKKEKFARKILIWRRFAKEKLHSFPGIRERLKRC